MTTQLTEAGQKLADALVKAGVSAKPMMLIREVGPLNTAAQILLTPEGGGGLREEARGYFDSLMQIVGWLRDAQRIPKPRDAIGLDDIDDDEIEAAAYFIDRLAALAPKTSAPGNDAGVREAVERACRAFVGPVWDAQGYTNRNYYRDAMRQALEAAALSPPTGSAGDDETGVREALRPLVYELPGGGEFFLDRCMAALDPYLATQPPKAETPAGVGEIAREFLKRWDQFLASDKNHECAHRFLVEGGGWEAWEAMRAALPAAPAARAGDGVASWRPISEMKREELVVLGWWQFSTLGFPPRWSVEVGRASDIGSATHFYPLPATPALTAAPAANGEGA